MIIYYNYTCLVPGAVGVNGKHAVLMLGLVEMGAAELSLSTAISFWRFCELYRGCTVTRETEISTCGLGSLVACAFHSPNLALIPPFL